MESDPTSDNRADAAPGLEATGKMGAARFTRERPRALGAISIEPELDPDVDEADVETTDLSRPERPREIVATIPIDDPDAVARLRARTADPAGVALPPDEERMATIQLDGDIAERADARHGDTIPLDEDRIATRTLPRDDDAADEPEGEAFERTDRMTPIAAANEAARRTLEIAPTPPGADDLEQTDRMTPVRPTAPPPGASVSLDDLETLPGVPRPGSRPPPREEMRRRRAPEKPAAPKPSEPSPTVKVRGQPLRSDGTLSGSSLGEALVAEASHVQSRLSERRTQRAREFQREIEGLNALLPAREAPKPAPSRPAGLATRRSTTEAVRAPTTRELIEHARGGTTAPRQLRAGGVYLAALAVAAVLYLISGVGTDDASPAPPPGEAGADAGPIARVEPRTARPTRPQPPRLSIAAFESAARALSNPASPEPTRVRAARQLARGGAEATGHLVRALLQDTPAVRGEAIRSLRTLRRDHRVNLLPLMRRSLPEKPTPRERIFYYEALGAAGPDAVPDLRDALAAEEDFNVRRAILTGLSRTASPDACDVIVPLLDSSEPGEIGEACIALGRLGCYRAVDPLIGLLRSSDENLQHSARWALEEITARTRQGGDYRYWQAWWNLGVRDAWIALEGSGGDLARIPEPRRLLFLRQLRTLRDPRVVELCRAALWEPDPGIRRTAAGTLGAFGRAAEAAVPDLIMVLAAPDPQVARAAHDALTAITGQRLPADPSAWTLWWEEGS